MIAAVDAARPLCCVGAAFQMQESNLTDIPMAFRELLDPDQFSEPPRGHSEPHRD
jgi:hypothetical protein